MQDKRSKNILLLVIPLTLLTLSLLSFMRELVVFGRFDWQQMALICIMLFVTVFMGYYLRLGGPLSNSDYDKGSFEYSFISFLKVQKVKYTLIFVIPTCLLILLFLILLRKAWPIEIFDWRLMAIISFILLIVSLIVNFIQQLSKLSTENNEPVSVKAVLIKMIKVKKYLFISLVLLVFGLGFIWLDNLYPSIKTERPPYLLAFAPNYDSDLLYVGMRDINNRKPTYIDILALSTGKMTEGREYPIPIVRMRPGKSGDDLIVSNFDSAYGGARILNLDGMLSTNEQFDYLEEHGIFNFTRNEVYYTDEHRGVRIVKLSEDPLEDSVSLEIEPGTRFYSVAIHPNKDIIFLIADNKIKVVDADSLETIDTIRLGGKLRDAAVSPSGESLYVADALWSRIRVIPIPAYADE